MTGSKAIGQRNIDRRVEGEQLRAEAELAALEKAPESLDKAKCGPKSEHPGLTARGKVIKPVPVTGFAANFSPMPRIAPPPFGKERLDGF